MSISRRREVLDVIGDSGVLPLFSCDDVEQYARRAVSFQVVPSQEPQP